MTTPPTNVPAGVSWEMIVAVVTALLSALFVMLRLLFKGIHKRIDTTEATLGKRIDDAIESDEALAIQIDAKLEEKFLRVHELVVQLGERVDKYFDAHERLRDKWDEFLKEYLKIDSTRGQKVDALFRLNDQMQKILDTLPRHVDSKIEEAFTHSLSELKLYIRELLAKERSNVQ